MQHILDCPDFLEKGVCDRGKSCPLRHRKRVLRTRNKITDDAKVEVLHCHRCVLATYNIVSVSIVAALLALVN